MPWPTRARCASAARSRRSRCEAAARRSLPTRIEFLLGTDPTVAFASGLYPIEELPRLGLLARVTFDIPQLPPSDAQYALQSSPDLATWTTIATKTGTGPWSTSAGVTVSSDPPVAGFVNTIVSETLPAATACRYHRLLGTQPQAGREAMERTVTDLSATGATKFFQGGDHEAVAFRQAARLRG